MKKVILIGRPNVGKSSLFNRIAKQRIAITSEFSGTTRDTNNAQIEIREKKCILVDSGGLDESNELFKNVKLNSLKSAKDADVILFMVDGKNFPDDIDKKLFYELSSLNKNIALIVNKVDSKKDEERSWEFDQFGSKNVFRLSVSHNFGTDELCEWIYNLLPAISLKEDLSDDLDDFLDNYDESSELEKIDYEKKNIKVGIIGRVNVGKSSLLNALVKESRSVVSSIAGTTIDPVNESYFYDNRIFEFIDTAGIRKRGKIEGIERFALNRTEKILEEADIALLVLDASETFNELDERIAGLAAKFELGIIIVLNKWDMGNGEFDKIAIEIKDRFKFLSYAPIISVSAISGKRIEKIYPLILEIYKNYTQKIKTSSLNSTLEEAFRAHPIPRDHGKIVKIYYGVQFSVAPPKIALIMNKPRSLHFSYKRYLLNKLRESYELLGTPVVLIPKNRNKESNEN